MSFCIYCGAPLNMDDRRCPQCGKELPTKTEENAQTYQGAHPQQTYRAQPQYQQPQYQQPYQQPQYQQPYQAQSQYPAYQRPTYAPRVADPEKTIATTLNTLGFLHGIFAILVMLFGYLSLANMRLSSYSTRIRPDDDFAIPAFIFCLAMIAVSVAGLAVATSKRRGTEKILSWVVKLIGSAVFAILFLTVFA